MFYHFTTAQIAIAVMVLVMDAIVVGEYLRRRKAKTAAFRKRFGSEYDRAVRSTALRIKPRQIWPILNPECMH